VTDFAACGLALARHFASAKPQAEYGIFSFATLD
jgi:hypothetical protein